ncbi:MAG: T9SS type A sorting domain-containing protein [Candidatus Latescibacteria bacterium]|nr:T9SS type A sorting domain-containing protein [Candidatus Latescibacterota bacterium]
MANPNSASTTVTVDSDKTVTANFAPPQYTITMTVIPAGGGTTGPDIGKHVYNVGTVVSITATPAEGYVFKDWSGEVADPNSASTTVTVSSDETITANYYKRPVILDTSLPDAIEGNEYNVAIQIEDSDSNTFTYDLTESPGWLMIDNSGNLSGTPERDDFESDIPVTITVTDDSGLTATFSTAINIKSPPVILNDGLTYAIEGRPYTDTIIVEELNENETWTIELVESPEWLSMDDKGVLSGIASKEDIGSNNDVLIIVKDSSGLTYTLSATVAIILDVAIESIVITPADIVVKKGEVFTFTAQAFNISGTTVPEIVFFWELSGDIGEINENGEFTAIKGGVGLVMASAKAEEGLVTAVAEVTVFLDKVPLPPIVENETTTIEDATYPLDILNGTEIFFPENSISEGISISVTLPDFTNTNDEAKEVNYDIDSDIVTAVSFEVIVEGVVVSPYYFQEPIEITIPYDLEKMTGFSVGPEGLGLFYVDDGGELILEGISDVSFDPETNTISAYVDHFSDFAVAPKYSGPKFVGDFNEDFIIDFYDFVQLVVYWNAGKIDGDIVGKPDEGSEAGPFPWYREVYPYPSDGVMDFEDVVIFSMMYNWYQSQNSVITAKPTLAAKEAPSLLTTGLNWDEKDYQIGDTFFVSFNPGNVSNFLGAEIVLNFDSNVLRVQKVSSGYGLINKNLKTPVQSKTSKGSLIANTVVLGNLKEGILISGESLFEIEFEVIGEGAFSIDMSSIDMRNFQNTVLPYYSENSSVSGKIVSAIPLMFNLSQNYPNPFNPFTTIEFSLPGESVVNLSIYNITGQKVRTLVSEPMTAGKHTIHWDGKSDSGHSVSSGVYIARITTVDKIATRSMMLMK